jgi:hypothetical protein
MSITNIASSILSALSGSQNNQSGFGQINSEFQQLGQDLQAGNLTQAQQDFTTLSQSLTGETQTSSAAASNTPSPLAQAINQLGQDLQSGNLAAALAKLLVHPAVQSDRPRVQPVGAIPPGRESPGRPAGLLHPSERSAANWRVGGGAFEQWWRADGFRQPQCDRLTPGEPPRTGRRSPCRSSGPRYRIGERRFYKCLLIKHLHCRTSRKSGR